MKIEDNFRVDVPIEEAWKVLLDLERIAPCMPGAELQEVEGEEFRGVVKVKVGPITAQYKGVAKFSEQDESAHRAVIDAQGRDTRGQGNAKAMITATLEADGDGTEVKISSDVTITGKVAQFGRGVMADVSSKLLGQFVECLERDVFTGGSASSGASGGASAASSAPAEESPAGPPTASPTVSPTAPPDAPAAPEPESPAEALTAPTRDEPPPPAAQPSAQPSVPTSSGPRRIESAPSQPVDLLAAAGAPVAKRLVPVVGAVVAVVVVLWVLRRRR